MPTPLSPDFFALIDQTAGAILGRNDAKGADLGTRVAALSHLYNLERDDLGESGEPEHAAARLRFFLPRDMWKVLPPVAELAKAGALPAGNTWRVLDVGAGYGAMTFGLAMAAKEHGVTELQVTATDTNVVGLRCFTRMASAATTVGLPKITLRTEAMDIVRPTEESTTAKDGPFDFILLGFVINELFRGAADPAESREALLLSLAARLAPGGSLIVLEPALREASRGLHMVRDRFDAAGGSPNIFAPCVRRGPCPALTKPRDWCHEDVDAELPAAMHETALAAGLRFTGLTYSYLVLRNDGKSLRDLGQAADQLYRVVSAPLRSKGKIEFALCGDPGMPRLARLDRHATKINAAVTTLDRGTVMAMDASDATKDPVRVRLGADMAVRPLITAKDAVVTRDKVPAT